jgi:hypothetical protein
MERSRLEQQDDHGASDRCINVYRSGICHYTKLSSHTPSLACSFDPAMTDGWGISMPAQAERAS